MFQKKATLAKMVSRLVCAIPDLRKPLS